jgi:predicted nucleotide-binding protein
MSTFIGYDDLRREIRGALRVGKSVALVGGRKCGGTALLLTLADEFDRETLPGFHVLPHVLDCRAIVPRSPFDFFRAVYSAATQGLNAESWTQPRDERHYQEFLEKLDRCAPVIEQFHGPDWLLVLLIDALDSAARFLSDGACFEHLRHLISNSKFASRFRLIVWGSGGMSDLLKAGNPLNILKPKYLRVLTVDEVRRIIAARLPAVSSQEHLILQLTGGQPYLLIELLRNLEESGGALDEQSIVTSGRRLVRDQMGRLKQWLHDIDDSGRLVYHALAASPTPLTLVELQCRVPARTAVDEGLVTLSYHCLVDDSNPNQPVARGSLFRDWFLDHFEPRGAPPAEPKPATANPPGKQVFVVHGRNEKARVAIFAFLRSVGLEPLEWWQVVEATGKPSPHISEILETGLRTAQAALVLLTPDDEARLREEFRGANDPQFEQELVPQPRPNVLFEAGMAWARFPNSTVLVQIGAVRPFSDIAGVHVLQMDGSYEKREDLVRRLKTAGCEVNDQGTRWHTAGDFAAAIPPRGGSSAVRGV